MSYTKDVCHKLCLQSKEFTYFFWFDDLTIEGSVDGSVDGFVDGSVDVGLSGSGT